MPVISISTRREERRREKSISETLAMNTPLDQLGPFPSGPHTRNPMVMEMPKATSMEPK
jgi:hypothetical protein